MQKKKKIIFIVSLSLNAVVLILLLVWGIKGIWFFSQLKDYREVKEIVFDKTVKTEFTTLKKMFIDFEKSLLQEPFDREMVEQELSYIQEQLISIQGIVSSRIFDHLESLSPQERVKFVRGIFKFKGHDRGDHDKHYRDNHDY